FVTQDGRRIMLVAITARQWSDLLAALGLSEPVAQLERDLRVSFADEGKRFEHRVRLFPLFEAAFAERSLAELERLFEIGGVCWSVYRTVHDAVTEDARLFVDNPIFSNVLQPSGLQYRAAGAPLRGSVEDGNPVSAAPRLGQHTDEILAQLLGMT